MVALCLRLLRIPLSLALDDRLLADTFEALLIGQDEQHAAELLS